MPNIEESGELIAVTISGPDTYFEFRGQGFGLQNELAKDYAKFAGLRLRMDIAHDTAEVISRLKKHEADIAVMELPQKTGTLQCNNRWLVSDEAPLLAQSINEWYSPELLERYRNHKPETQVRRSARPVMLNASTGQISQYDALFQRCAVQIGWDWRLLAAQCYQESAFDPQAISWTGAQGLMQIMPGTASHLGVDASDIFNPETNVEASVRYIKELSQTFSDIPGSANRIPFILAAYNGGTNHVRDAMALTRKHGKDAHVWRNVEPYILKLSEAAYYTDPVVTSGYLRGSETYNYVRSILDRWAGYRGQARNFSRASIPAPSKKPKQTIDVKRPHILITDTL